MFMQIWDYQILTLKISLKFVGLCGKHESLVKPYIDTQYPLTQTSIFPLIGVNIFSFLILIQQLI